MILNGKAVAADITGALEKKIAIFRERGQRPPGLAVVVVGDNPASHSYVKKKREVCAEIGIRSILHHLPSDVGQEELFAILDACNDDDAVDGILVQLPLPGKMSPIQVMERVLPEKDVDGFTPTNLGKLLSGDKSGFVPCTPLGIQTLLHKCGIAIAGKHVVVIGRSTIVGKPLAALLCQRDPQANATVTIAHTATQDLGKIARSADILVASIGHPRAITADMVQDGTVVVDVGINAISAPERKSGTRLVGDVDFDQVVEKAAAITPVPGGVGPMTIAMLMSNTVKSYENVYREL